MGTVIKERGSSSLWTIFVHADRVDILLMTLGFLGAVGDGFSTPLMLFITSQIMNNLGGASHSSPDFTQKTNKNAVSLLYLACGLLVACFLEGYCWSRTGERQASRMRARYLKAVLRQDVGYFDLQVASTTEVVIGVSNDSNVIQDVLSEKVPNFVMNVATFIGSYVVAFLMLWRMALVAFPFVLLLIIPGLMYGRMLMSLARKIRNEYNKAGSIAEQSISSVRTVYSFVGERKTLAEFSAALQGSVKLGLRQGLAKGLAIGSNGITFAIWSFMAWYGSRLVMYHGGKGGSVFAVGAAIAVGGLALGSGLSNVKYLSEASTASERTMHVMNRVPKIDPENMEGEILESISGEVEFKNVEFAYPSRPDTIIFHSFCLTVPAGKAVALVGGSGSGKSTVIALLQRFYDPLGGEILVDGINIQRIQLKWLRSQMGLVSQEPALFATSIKENILFGKEEATMEEVIAAAKAANAHDFISQLPLGYDTQVRSLVGDRMALVVQTFSAVIIAWTMGLIIAWRLALVIIAVQPIIIVCFYARKVLLKSMSNKAIKAQDESSKLAAEAVANLRIVAAFSSQGRILRMFDMAQDGPRRESIKQSLFAGLGLGTAQSLMICTWALDFWYGGKLIADGYISAKALFQTFMILVSTGRVIAEAGSMTTDLAKGSDAVRSVFAVLDRYTHIEPEDPDGRRPNKLTGNVELRDVDFAYPARPDVTIFKGFSLNIEAGRSTALVGQSGSGKSTIIGLIERFYDPTRGTVRIDGKDIRSFNLRSMRKHIALVSQEPTLFSGSIRENIAYGMDMVGEMEIMNAARAANAHEFISCLKDGYDTWCGDRGVQLSGGQKQRIAIARALLKNPAILLLDEATSALDSQSEKVVQEALDMVMVGRTSVVVAHRLSTIQNCDVIAVLEHGAVVEKGTHASLLAMGPKGSYFSLVNLQRPTTHNS
ncbi:ABC transporter B family member 15-like isoform X2 [Magnolia sinica]|uniref:ABC transporter B family member 15-like isoform X2 n=1 Tax=Magnolia sinica TaxID=86752 RepID=UPI00265ABB4E|nr:ABC transporter B family member 15-like isoform X2 [Magnolia sinica]